MQIAKVIGTVTLARQHPMMQGARLRLAIPQSLANLRGDAQAQQEPLVVYDELGAGHGSLIALSEGREAAQPFDPAGKPIDAYNAAILDWVEVGRKTGEEESS
jgi:ethanolamine utilization protein EutN